MIVQGAAPSALIFFSFLSLTGRQEDAADSCSPSSMISADNFWRRLLPTLSYSLHLETVWISQSITHAGIVF